MKPIIYIVDAFTDKPFKGNPAAVCIHQESIPTRKMQAIASEINLSETAFVMPHKDGFRLRWFTPAIEVELCGHATLASAHILYEQEIIPIEETIRFRTLSGVLTAQHEEKVIRLDFPKEIVKETEAPPHLLESLGLSTASYIGKNRFDYLVEVDNAEAVRSMKPDFGRMALVESRGVIVTASSDMNKVDFISRCFYPQAGIDEDPVTGSAHCGLGPYWQGKLKKNQLSAYQASARGGTIWLDVHEKRIDLKGKAITIMESRLMV